MIFLFCLICGRSVSAAIGRSGAGAKHRDIEWWPVVGVTVFAATPAGQHEHFAGIESLTASPLPPLPSVISFGRPAARPLITRPAPASSVKIV